MHADGNTWPGNTPLVSQRYIGLGFIRNVIPKREYNYNPKQDTFLLIL